MLFNSLEFALFLAVVYGLYLLLGRRGQNRWLLLASYVFYGAWDSRFLLLIVVSTLIDYTIGLKLGASDDPRRRKRLVLVSLVANLGILGFFKYADFFSRSFADLMLLFGVTVEPWLLDVVLPVGISFYTFQTLSYTIDVYRRDLEPTRDLLDFGLYVSFFPQLVAGPIERASRLMPQILERRQVTWGGFGSGCWLILAGTVKKVVIADRLSALVDGVYGQPDVATGFEVVLATWAFAWQIYCDFSGYTDVARGVARLMGFDLMVNFRLPYLAVNPSDFWRRWHISLSTWLRDYLYIPLGGNRGGPWGTYRNLFLTMVLGGLWHGAAWTFVIWGVYQGALLIGHRLLEPTLKRLAPAGGVGATVWWVVRVLVMFQLACVGWMIFRAEDLAQLTGLLAALSRGFAMGDAALWLEPAAWLILPLFAFQWLQEYRKDLELILTWPAVLRTAVYVVLVFAIILLGEDGGSPFLYFQF